MAIALISGPSADASRRPHTVAGPQAEGLTNQVVGLGISVRSLREPSPLVDETLAVEHLRHLWRPDHVRVVLLAESHVWTSREEAKSRVIQPDGVETGFARFIYCLGGGEPQLVFPSVSPNVGASQYWTLLHDSVYGPDQSHQALLKSGEPKSSRRVANKLKLLHEMRGSGPALSHRRCADNPFTPQVCQAKQR